MTSEPTEAIIKREVARARRILREDGVLAKLAKHFPDEPPADPAAPPPDRKETPADPTPPARKGGIWWGDTT